SSSLDYLQTPSADDHRAGSKPLLQPIEVDRDVIGERMSRRQVLGFDLRPTARAVVLDDTNPLWIRGEIEFAGDKRRVNLLGIAGVDEAAFLVAFAPRP